LIQFLKPAPGTSLTRRLKAAIDDPEMEQLLDSWLELAGTGDLPEKSEFDPLNHPTVLPRIWIYELEEDRSDFVCRLCGEEIRYVWGHTTKGLRLSQIASPELFRTNMRRWLYCIEAPAVLLGQSTEQSRFIVKRLSLPFRNGLGQRFVLGASRYDFRHVDPFDQRHPFRYSQSAVAVRTRDLLLDAARDEPSEPAQQWTAQASASV